MRWGDALMLGALGLVGWVVWRAARDVNAFSMAYNPLDGAARWAGGAIWDAGETLTAGANAVGGHVGGQIFDLAHGDFDPAIRQSDVLRARLMQDGYSRFDADRIIAGQYQDADGTWRWINWNLLF